jgi:hypothetical protein
MNTDNMSIVGETIDYGPCAFMDAYNPRAVYSSIDKMGCYAYGNQPDIAQASHQGSLQLPRGGNRVPRGFLSPWRLVPSSVPR